MRISEKRGISVVLCGTSRLDEILDAQHRKRYLPIHNTFLNHHRLSVLSMSETATAIGSWENTLGISNPMGLATNETIVKSLNQLSDGQIQPLYDLLKRIAIWHLDNPHIEINANNIFTLLTTVQAPQVGLE
jgi:hypothetical protein